MLLAFLPVAGARAQESGPALSVPPAALDAALKCTGDLRSGPTPVLLVPGTGEDPRFYAWNYVPAFTKRGIPHCTLETPGRATEDIQVAAEFVVHGIRTMRERAGRRVSVLGHSQGGMVPRWALKYWPDTRAMVDDLVGLASSNHGTEVARGTCQSSCNAAAWQQRDDAKFIQALNAGPETFAGISYTTAYTRFDQVVTPNQDEATGSSSLRTGEGRRANVRVQDICPANTSEHLVLGSYDPVGYALAIDALTHDGPADPARIDPAVCAQPYHEGIDPATFATDSATGFGLVLEGFGGGSEYLPAEPPLKCYVTATCPGGSDEEEAAPALSVRVAPRRVRAGRRVRVRVVVRSGGTAVRGARIRLNGRRARTDARGRAVLRIRFTRLGPRTVRASRAGYRSARATLRVTR